MPNSDKLWLQGNLNAIATQQASAAIASTGRALPSTVTAVNVGGNASLVTVKFEVVVPYVVQGVRKTYTLPPLTLPKAESQWLRAPVQVGDVGLTVPADTFLGGISGQGSGVANLGTDYGNLSTLVWVPVAAKSFGAAPDLNKAWVNGPAGAVVSDTAETATMTAALNVVTHQAGTQTLVVSNAPSAPAITATVEGGAGALQTIVDGAGNAISQVVPSGGLVGLGEVASSLPTTAAAISNSDVSTFENSLYSQRLKDLETLVTAFVNAGATGGVPYPTIVAQIATLLHIPVPAGSSVVRVAATSTPPGPPPSPAPGVPTGCTVAGSAASIVYASPGISPTATFDLTATATNGGTIADWLKEVLVLVAPTGTSSWAVASIIPTTAVGTFNGVVIDLTPEIVQDVAIQLVAQDSTFVQSAVVFTTTAQSLYPSPTTVAPTTSGVTLGNASTPTTLASDISAALTVTNVPQDSSANSLAYYYRQTGTTDWVPYGELTLAGSPKPAGTITMPTFIYGQLANGISYDFAVGYGGLSGYGPLTTIATGMTANSIVVTTPYIIGTTSPTPTVTSVTTTPEISANGIAAAIRLQFTLTNQPVDGSLSRLSVYFRVTGATAWTFYTSTGVPGLPVPPASQAYDITLADLTNGQNYDFACGFENAQGQDSATLGEIATNVAAAVINLPSAALSGIPSGFSFTVTSPSITGYTSTLAGAYGATIDFVITATNAGTPANWLGHIDVYTAPTGTTNWSLNTTISRWAALGTTETADIAKLGAGQAYDVACVLVAINGAATAMSSAFLTTVAQTIGAPSLGVMPSALLTNGPTITASSASGSLEFRGLGIKFSWSVTETDWTTTPPTWLKSFNLHQKLSTVVGDGSNTPIKINSSTTGVYTGEAFMAAGDTVELGFSYTDLAGNTSAVVFPTGLNSVTDPNGPWLDTNTNTSLHTRESLPVQGTIQPTINGPSYLINGAVGSEHILTGTGASEINIDLFPDNVHAKTVASHVVGGVAYNYKGVWVSTTAYVQGDEVVYGDSYWLALLGSTNSAPATGNANWQVVGTYSGFDGAWVSTTAYPAGAEVTYSDNFWVCVTANTNSAPTVSNANWQIAGPTSLDAISDGATYTRTLGSVQTGNIPDLSKGIVGKVLDNIADSTDGTRRAFYGSRVNPADAFSPNGGDFHQAPQAVTFDGPIQYNGNAPSGIAATCFYCRWVGFIYLPTAGVYTIGLNSDDAGNLYVGGQKLVSALGVSQGATTQPGYTQSGTFDSSGGWYPIIIEWQQGYGPYGCWLNYTPPGGSVTLVPSTALSTRPDVVTGTLQGFWWNGDGYCWYPSTTQRTTDYLSEGTNKFAAEHGADITGNHTANDTANVNAVAAASISPIATLMPAEAGAVTIAAAELAGAAGAHTVTRVNDGTNIRDAAALAANMNSSGQSLLVPFSGYVQDDTGALTGAKSGSSTQQFLLTAGIPFTIEGQFQLNDEGNCTVNVGLVSPSTSCYAFLFYNDGGGAYASSSRWNVNGVDQGGLPGAGYYVFTSALDTNYHSFKITIIPGSPNTIEMSIDGAHQPPFTDSEITLTTGTWPIGLYTTSATNRWQQVRASNAGPHYLALPQPARTAFDNTGNVKNLGGTAAASITPIATLMPAEVGADVTASNYAAGTGSGAAQRTAAAMAANMNASGQGLLNAFAGSTLRNDGSLNIGSIGGPASQGYLLPAGTMITMEAKIAKGIATDVLRFHLALLGNFSNSYGLEFDNGAAYMAKWVTGAAFGISTAVTSPVDTNYHSLRLSITVLGASNNTLEATIDGLNIGIISDTSLDFTSGLVYPFIIPASPTDLMYGFEITTALSHYLALPPAARTAFDSAGQVIGSIYDGTTALSPANLTNAVTTGGLVKVANATGEIPYANTSSEYQTNFNSAGLAQNTTMFNDLGICINNTAGNPGYSYTSTTTSIDLTIPASTYTRSDNSTVSVSQYSHDFSGLTSLHGYYFDMWYDAPSNTFGAAIYASGSPSAATKLADCYAQGRTPVNAGVYIVTPSSGTGSGSGAAGSGGCPADYQIVETQERGMIRADELEVGMHLPHGSEWVRINGLERRPAPLWRYTVRGHGIEEAFDVNDTHASLAQSGEWVLVRDMSAGTILHGGAAVLDSHYIGEGHYIAIEVEGHVYSLGKTLAHNISL